MGREEEKYTWLAQVAKLQWRGEDDEGDKPAGMAAMATVEAVAGRLENPRRKAANDVAALLIAAALILLLAYVNSRAKVRVPGSFLREIRGGAIWWSVTAETAWLQAALILAAVLAQCQNDHLPTIRRQQNNG